MDELKDISLLLLAGGDGRPDAFAPSHSGLAACALRDTAINDRVANVPLRAVVGRLKKSFLMPSIFRMKVFSL